jgi:hypothetical protein
VSRAGSHCLYLATWHFVSGVSYCGGAIGNRTVQCDIRKHCMHLVYLLDHNMQEIFQEKFASFGPEDIVSDIIMFL